MKPTWIDYAELFPHDGSWMIRYTSERIKREITHIMGTNVIPTAYTTAASFDEVARRLRAIPANFNLCIVEASR